MTSLTRITEIIDKGGVCILPTETVYGIAALAENKNAIDRIYAIKGRDFDKPLAVCISDLEGAKRLAQFDETALRLARKFWPGPLTLVLPAADKVLDTRCYQGNTIALRCPDIEWREAFTTPLALTSANRSGEPASITAQNDLDVDAILDTGPSREKSPSTILNIKDGKITCLRAGALNPDAFAEFNIEWDHD